MEAGPTNRRPTDTTKAATSKIQAKTKTEGQTKSKHPEGPATNLPKERRRRNKRQTSNTYKDADTAGKQGTAMRTKERNKKTEERKNKWRREKPQNAYV